MRPILEAQRGRFPRWRGSWGVRGEEMRLRGRVDPLAVGSVPLIPPWRRRTIRAIDLFSWRTLILTLANVIPILPFIIPFALIPLPPPGLALPTPILILLPPPLDRALIIRIKAHPPSRFSADATALHVIARGGARGGGFGEEEGEEFVGDGEVRRLLKLLEGEEAEDCFEEGEGGFDCGQGGMRRWWGWGKWRG